MKLRSVALAALLFAGLPLASSSAYVGISVGIAPPSIPVYVQPACPVEGYLWTPGYWGYGNVGYYWVPGVWVPPPRIGVYWTPSYWGYDGGSYLFHSGYWGPSVGFYGGINYGFGYFGSGYYGGQWAGDRFRYNTAVTRVNTNIVRNVYVNKTVINNYGGRTRPGGASFNGPGGTKAKASAKEQAVADAEKVPATPEQQKVEQAASKNPEFHAAKNGGKPKVAALKTPDEVSQSPAGAADASEPGKKGGKGANAEADTQKGDTAATGPEAADKGAKKAADASGDRANSGQERKAAKSKGQRADGMPAQANDPNLPQQAIDNGRAADAIANRGPQHRSDSTKQRKEPTTHRSSGARAKVARRPATEEATPEPKKRKRDKDKEPDRGF